MQELLDIKNRLINNIQERIIGQDEIVKKMIIVFISGGHVLIEGIPGLAKTLLVRTLANAISLDFNRIQFTPDLMPSDITGINIFNNKTNKFEFIKGPVFCNILLADEINRTPAKTQAALLEAMEENAVTIDGTRRELPYPFFTAATENPIEEEGVYSLPQAETDRFAMKLNISYPDSEAEFIILKKHNNNYYNNSRNYTQASAITKDEYLSLRNYISSIRASDEIIDYISRIVQSLRKKSEVKYGPSVRGGVQLIRLGKVAAFLNDRTYVIPDDIKEIAVDTLAHRIILYPETILDNINEREIIKDTLKEVEVPR